MKLWRVTTDKGEYLVSARYPMEAWRLVRQDDAERRQRLAHYGETVAPQEKRVIEEVVVESPRVVCVLWLDDSLLEPRPQALGALGWQTTSGR